METFGSVLICVIRAKFLFHDIICVFKTVLLDVDTKKEGITGRCYKQTHFDAKTENDVAG